MGQDAALACLLVMRPQDGWRSRIPAGPDSGL